jgi:hypothetical protein
MVRSKIKVKQLSLRSAKSRRRSKFTSSGTSGGRAGGVLKLAGIAIVLAVVAGGLHFAEKYVKRATGAEEKNGQLELVNVPAWVSEELKAQIYRVAGAERLKLDDSAARQVAERVSGSVHWLRDVRVQVGHDRITLNAVYRKPVALVKSGLQKFYVDEELVVLDYLPLAELPVVTVKGVSFTRQPAAGTIFNREDLSAGVAVLKLLARMDERMAPQKPLLREIDSIDVTNFMGRRNPQGAHIVLYARDGTQLVWGAEVGMWQRHLEAKDDEKLATLYSFYAENGTLMGSAKYIELRNPQRNLPEPIERY